MYSLELYMRLTRNKSDFLLTDQVIFLTDEQFEMALHVTRQVSSSFTTSNTATVNKLIHQDNKFRHYRVVSSCTYRRHIIGKSGMPDDRAISPEVRSLFLALVALPVAAATSAIDPCPSGGIPSWTAPIHRLVLGGGVTSRSRNMSRGKELIERLLRRCAGPLAVLVFSCISRVVWLDVRVCLGAALSG